MKKSNLRKFSMGSKLMNINIKYGTEKIKFNLYEELVVSEDRINTELKEQPATFGFLSLLHKKLNRIKDDLEAEKDKIWGEIYLEAKSQRDENTGRPYANDSAKELANSSPKVHDIILKLNKAKEQAEIIGACVRSFEQRSHLVQSLSANLRREN